MKKKTEAKKIRVRMAPSPTGPMHIGGGRTALFNYLFAKKNKGSFILRIEDTDKERSDQKWAQEIIDEFRWLGLEWDEGPDVGGELGPYKQSQRLHIYKTYLEQLLAKKKAYYCTCSSEELETKRQDQQSRGLAPKYDGTCRDKNNSDGVIRFRITEKKVRFTDVIRREVEFNAALLGDIVIAKSLENPLYHFAVVVDDFLMEISHVIRGEEHLSNTPRQILLQEALGFYQPIYAHLPLMLNADKSKMSKRAGDVAISDYHKNGYLPEALVNFIVLLGWNPGTKKEIFSLNELEQEFSLEKVQKSGAVFNTQRLDFINAYYIKRKSAATLVKVCAPWLPESAKKLPAKTLEKVIELHKPRMKKLADITEMADYFFAEKLEFDSSMLAWKEMLPRDVKEALLLCDKTLAGLGKWDMKKMEKELVAAAEKFNQEKGYPVQNRGYLLWPLRVALSGKKASAGPFEIAEILGKEKTLQRIKDALIILS